MADPLSLLEAPLAAAVRGLGDGAADAAVALEQPADASHGDYATTVALRLAKPLRRAPREIAETLRQGAAESEWVESADIAGPGFVNLRVSPAWYAEVVRLAQAPGYGGGAARRPLRANVEFVSANPTGRLPVSAGRNAAYGDCLARLLAFAGHEVTREYYFNDAGSQIERFGLSLRARASGEDVPEDGYQGEYVRELAEQLALPADATAEEYARAGVERMFDEIKATLVRFRAPIDVFTNEADLHADGALDRARERATAAGHVFEADGAVWLRTSDFGDDKDRVIVRADGSTTYFAADLAYLLDKFDRGYELALYVLGADHHGYIGRLKAGAAALGLDPSRVQVPIYQMVHLVEGGVQKRMSKRRGDIVYLDDLIDAIGVDAARLFLVWRSHDQTLDIDLELAAEQGPENPVYYVQYAHARIASILRKAGALADDAAPDPALAPEPSEAALVRRLAAFPGVAEAAAELWAPHRIVHFAHALAADFHAFYRDCKVLDEADPARTRARLALCEGARAVLARSLGLVGVSAPDEM